ncbi:hypothetical protein TNCV_4201041 [Trichonephila clavipes]|uniref:Uncharacterized protein n=1 Tax=Trichonephila clavipes TaxID=2585209 RepID=A0A8X6WBQ2_TRICX|nr:hypothetical protein TNCV_4201041 [Trichonephila clavipes]
MEHDTRIVDFRPFENSCVRYWPNHTTILSLRLSVQDTAGPQVVDSGTALQTAKQRKGKERVKGKSLPKQNRKLRTEGGCLGNGGIAIEVSRAPERLIMIISLSLSLN